MDPRPRNTVIPALLVGGLVFAAWACGGTGDTGGNDGSTDAPAEEGVSDHHVSDAHPHDAPDDVHTRDAKPDVEPFDGGPDVRPPLDGGSDVKPSDTGSDVRPLEGGFDVRPLEGGFDVRPLEGGFDVKPIDSSFDVVPPPIDSPVDSPSFDAGPTVTIATGETPTALAVDDTHVYWENSGGPVLDCPVAGCPGNVPTLLAFNGSGFGLETLAVGASTAFFVDTSSNIDTCASAGCGLAPTTYEAVPDAGFFFFSTSLVADATNLYFTDGNVVYSCPLGSTCSAPIALYTETSPSASLGALAVSATDVFFVRQAGVDSLRSVPIAGGADVVVCATASSGSLSGVQAMVATSTNVYFTSYSGFSTNHIYQCPTTGGTKPAIYATDVAPYGLAADAMFLYWTNDIAPGNISACALGTTCPVYSTVATGQNTPSAIAVNSTTIFWTTTTAIYSATK
jgi:hypothetical protein